MSCSISRMVSFFSSRSLRMKAASSADSRGFIPAVGSSSSRTLGSAASARPRARPPLIPVRTLRGEPVEYGLGQSDIRQQFAGPLPGFPLLAADPGRTEDRPEQSRPHPDVLSDHYVLDGRHRAEQADVLEG